ncbi:MAG: type II toxin-antitoxin system PemK/MazF family toxin [Geminicoccales bacterium]
MRRGDIVTVAAGGGYDGKPRPAVIVQLDAFAATASVTVCLLTRRGIDAPLLRLPLTPSHGNGLTAPSWIMVDKVVTVPRAKVGSRVGSLLAVDVARLNRALAVFLAIAGA